MSAAVQLSGLADRIGMAQSTQVVQTKMLDYFFSLRKLHTFAYQPIVTLATGELYEYECLFRPQMPMLQQSISSVVQAAINTDRGIELDTYIVATALERIGKLEADRAGGRHPAAPLRHQPHAVQPARPGVRGERAGRPGPLLRPRAAPDHDRVHRAAVRPRSSPSSCARSRPCARLGFGFAVDDAGAGYASFALIAALKPSVIKIDRDIVTGLNHDDAKQALVEAFVSFGRRIGAHLLAEGIERRADLTALTALGVELGQGYLLGRPAADPAAAAAARPSASSASRRLMPKPRVAVRRASRVPSRA